ncbi:MAG: glutamine-hydrolyzing GMP synthase, partial [Mycobacterium sp.]|uniref:glutamine-hydrolyzing GMP synthase n=1 Tax=Mycobacterium sp. TaxID=1785 RepID=UPI003C619FB4
MESATPRPVLVVDFGAQYAQLIARRVREARVFSEVIPHTASVDEIKARDPLAVVLSGGPASVYAEGAPQLDPALFDLGVPVFGICYGFQAMAQELGGTVAHTGTSEYGRTELKVVGGELHSDLPDTQPVWMSHGDAVTSAPDGFEVVATSAGAPVAAFENRARRLAGVQYHPEVLHSPHGQQVLSRFLHEFAGIAPDWTPAGIAEALIEQVRNQVGDGHAICGLSGGVDSAVAAALLQRAIGDRLTCVFVDHGLLRAGERAQVQRDFVAATGANLVTVDAEETFLQALSGVTNPEGKRKIIGRQFIRAFEGAVRDALGDNETEFLVQGTLYPDVVESGGGTGAANIKSHHNVGGLP